MAAPFFNTKLLHVTTLFTVSDALLQIPKYVLPLLSTYYFVAKSLSAVGFAGFCAVPADTFPAYHAFPSQSSVCILALFESSDPFPTIWA